MTGMPAASAFLTGEVNAGGESSEVGTPSTFDVVAPLIESTISPTLLVAEPVQLYEQPSSLQASEAPLWVGVKNTFVVTWFTIVNLWGAPTPKIELPALDELPLEALAVPLPEPLDPQACSARAATPAAPPVSAARRVT